MFVQSAHNGGGGLPRPRGVRKAICTKWLAALCAVFLLSILPVTAAHAYSDEPEEDTADETEAVDDLLDTLLEDFETDTPPV